MTTTLSFNTDLLGSARVALVHDWLTTYVGGERVLEQMIALNPAADVLTSIDVLAEHERAFLQGKRPITTFAQHWPQDKAVQERRCRHLSSAPLASSLQFRHRAGARAYPQRLPPLGCV